MIAPASPERWPELMDRPTAAAYWSISERKFAELVACGVVTGRQLGPRLIRYSRRELDAAAEQLPRGKGPLPASRDG
jgi:hypothetical protein